MFEATPLKSATSVFTFFLAFLFIAYCVVYLYACPSLALATAISAEVGALLISIIIFKTKVFRISTKFLEFVPSSLRRCFQKVESTICRCKICVLSIISLAGLFDFTALSLSACGFYQPSRALYVALPFTYWLGLHPAFSLEILAGAQAQNKNFSCAEPLYLEVLEIRKSLSGPNSDLVGAVYADLGDLYVRKQDLPSAELWYRRSVALGTRTGRAYTALATVLRERGELSESKQVYLKALEVRKQIYGTGSKQYVDTQRGYLRLKQLEDQNTANESAHLQTLHK